MGMGMLGALGGLGDAGVQIGNQMMQGAIRSDLQKEHMEILRQERERVESVAEAKRAKIGEIIRNASSGSMQGEGPPTEDGVMPKRPMTDREQVVASGKGLIGAGFFDEGQKLLSMASRESTTEDKLINALTLQGMRNDGSMARVEKKEEGKDNRLDKTIGSRESLAANSLAAKAAEGKANREAYGKNGNEDKIWTDTQKEYAKFFHRKDQQGNDELDAVGKSAFDKMLSIQRKGRMSPADAANDAVTAIQKIRQKSTIDGVLNVEDYNRRINALFESLNKR